MTKDQFVDDDISDKYDIEFQRLVFDCLLSDTTSFIRARSILDETYFHDTLRKAVRFTLEYYDEHHKIPSVEMVKAKSGVTVMKSSEAGDHSDWLLNEVEGFCRYKALESAILEGAMMLQSGKGADIESRIKKAMTISLISDLGTSYFENPRSRIDRLKDHSAYVSTGWDVLDAKLYGGFTRGALNVFAGGSGSGKSLFLQNLGLNWAFAGLNVVYISLELSEDLVALRLDSMVSGKGTSDIFRHVDEISASIELRGKTAGCMVIKKLPEGGTCANDLRAYLKEYQLKTGLKVDALIVDYLDLMYPNNKDIDQTNLFVKDKFTSEEMRAVAGEFDILCVTASQLNRASVTASGEFDHSHIAGGISKINTADNVFGIFTTLAKRETGVYELQFLKTRSSSAVGSKIELGYDPVCMRITDPTGVDITKALSREKLRQQLNEDAKPSTKPVGLMEEEPLAKTSPGVMDLISKMKKKAEVNA